jgi:peptidoglycan/LPS O-acetylase OafA/YrhL
LKTEFFSAPLVWRRFAKSGDNATLTLVKHRLHFAALDSWRGIAAIAVALLHCPAYGYVYSLPFVRHSGLFVDFFFVLSGFVIAYNYGDQVRNLKDVFLFMQRRFARLWPLRGAQRAIGSLLVGAIIERVLWGRAWAVEQHAAASMKRQRQRQPQTQPLFGTASI